MQLHAWWRLETDIVSALPSRTAWWRRDPYDRAPPPRARQKVRRLKSVAISASGTATPGTRRAASRTPFRSFMWGATCQRALGTAKRTGRDIDYARRRACIAILKPIPLRRQGGSQPHARVSQRLRPGWLARFQPILRSLAAERQPRSIALNDGVEMPPPVGAGPTTHIKHPRTRAGGINCFWAVEHIMVAVAHGAASR